MVGRLGEIYERARWSWDGKIWVSVLQSQSQSRTSVGIE